MPSSKLDEAIVREGIRAKLDEPTTVAVLHEIHRIDAEVQAANQEEAAASGEKTKKYLTVIRPLDTTEIAWVIAVDEVLKPHEVPERINHAIADYNISRKGKVLPIRSLGEGLERVPAKTFLAYGISIRTPIPTNVIPVSNTVSAPVQETAAG